MKYRGAIIGFGNVAEQGHLPAWLQDARFELSAVVDSSPQRLWRAQVLLPEAARYQSLDECFAREKLDFIDICTPPVLHDNALVAACRRDVHILCEKPLTLSVELMRQLRRYAVERDRAVVTVHNWQYAPLFRTIRATIAAGTIGAPESLEWRVLRTQPAGTTAGGLGAWRADRRMAGGGILVDHGWHLFYLAPFLLGQEPDAIAVRLEQRRLRDNDLEDTATGTIRCGAASVHFQLTWAAERRANEGVLRGTEGSIYFEAAMLRVERLGTPVDEQRLEESLIASSYHPAWFAPLIQDFHRALEEPHYREINLYAAAACRALTQQGYESHRRGGIELPVSLS